MNDQLFEKNLNYLLASNPNFLAEKNISFDVAKNKALLSSYEAEVSHWKSLEKRSIHLPNQSPRNEASIQFVNSSIETHRIDDSIEPIINRQVDITLWRYLSQLRQIVIESDFDPDHTVTSMSSGGVCMVALGTGSGHLLLEQIQAFQPYRLSILLTDWHDYISSFWVVDWKNLYDEFAAAGSNISVGAISNAKQLLSACCAQGLLWLDHCYLFSAPSTDDQLVEYSKIFSGHELSNLIHYLGYTVDEYNMMVQSSLTLKREPKVFSAPLKPVGGKFIVCGSGPSLDASLPIIEQLQNDHVIVCGGSSYKALTDRGIRVDYLTLMERDYDIGNDDYGGYNESLKSPITTRLVMADVCWHEMLDAFPDHCVFYRAALTPLSIFCTDAQQILGYEGPEAVNCAISFCTSLGADSIAFFGVDLGSFSSETSRSDKVLGNSNRSFDTKVEGNLRDEVYTCTSMLNVQQVIEVLLYEKINVSNTHTKFINCSDGVRIDGATPMEPRQYLLDHNNSEFVTQSSHDDWWISLKPYTTQRLSTQWNYRNPRHQTFRLCRELETLYGGDTPFYPDVLVKTEALMNIDCDVSEQFPRRVMRGTLLKAVLAMSQQLQIMKGNQHSDIPAFGAKARGKLVELTLTLESEIYMLLDYIENNLF